MKLAALCGLALLCVANVTRADTNLDGLLLVIGSASKTDLPTICKSAVTWATNMPIGYPPGQPQKGALVAAARQAAVVDINTACGVRKAQLGL